MVKSNILDECYEKAKDVIKICSTRHGLHASGGIRGYNAVWARDSMISIIGASAAGFKQVFKSSLITLAKNQSKKGQIPNCVDKWGRRKPHVDFASIDSSLWYIIGHHVYMKRYGEKSLFKRYKKSLDKTLLWLTYQDVGEDGMLEQLPTTDWQDAFPHVYGDTVNTQALYYQSLKLAGKKKEANRLKLIVNNHKDKRLWSKDFYIPYRWKNHGKYKEKGDWFDSLGNLLAILFDMADRKRALRIISYVEKKKINKPYPCNAIHPPIKKGSKYWQDYFKDCDAREANHYLNGGIWPFIGAFYVLCLIKLKKFKKAGEQLNKLAEANLKGNFPEWIDPKTKESYGSLQAWDAGIYILAYHSFKKKRVLI